MKRIVIVSDCSDVAYNELRATILAELDKHRGSDVSVEPLVKAEEFSLINGAFLVRLMAEVYSPNETIFLVILNPLTTDRVDRARIVGETKNGFKFVGENTGTLNWLIEDFGLKRLFEVKAPGLKGKDFIPFGGKYIHAPIAAKIASGQDLSEFGIGKSKNFLTKFKVSEGTVVHIDNFGVAKVKSRLPKAKEGEKIGVYINGKKRINAIFTRCMKDLPDGEWAVFPGSSVERLSEIGRVRKLGSAKKLRLKLGDIIEFRNVRKHGRI